jgi:protein-L-isoaspartate(D-aspartate) O-methyltransferase
VPRHAYVHEDDEVVAYLNRPLPIGHGQTISQPFIVALMTDLLDLEPRDRVLEIGTGSGYQTAVLAELAERVYSIEAVPELATRARLRLEAAGYRNIEIRAGDGRLGWPEAAPFDAILVTAAAKEIPPALIEQLKPGGRLVIPVGPVAGPQTLYRGVRERGGRFVCARLLPVAFVPLVAARNAG